jgi:hypothetical protein
MESLLQETSSDSTDSAYEVTLLLPARHAALNSAPQQPEDPVPHASKQQADMQDNSNRLDSENEADAVVTIDETRSSDTSAAGVQPTRPGSAQRSSRQGMLLSVHVEQEVAGQMHLAELTQYVPAGEKGIIRTGMAGISHPASGPHGTLCWQPEYACSTCFWLSYCANDMHSCPGNRGVGAKTVSKPSSITC